MAINSDYLIGNSGTITTTTAIKGKGVEDMGIDDFFNLLTAQMTNQDMMNPADNTQMVAQMAQFTTLQGMKTIQEYQQSSYASTYIGKTVTIASENSATGALETIKGVVEKVAYYDGKPQVYVNGKGYDLYTVMEINNTESYETGTANSLNQLANYIGKTVTLTATDEDDMPYDLVGIVESVTLKGGQQYVMVGGKEYPASAITEVRTAPDKADSTDKTDSTEKEEDKNDTEPQRAEDKTSNLDTDDAE